MDWSGPNLGLNLVDVDDFGHFRDFVKYAFSCALARGPRGAKFHINAIL